MFEERILGKPSPAEFFLIAIHEFKKPVVAAVSGFAVEIGVVNAVVEDDKLFAHAMEKAVALTRQPSEALLLTKQFLKTASQETVLARIKDEGKDFGRLLFTPASIEARKKARPHHTK